MDLVILQDGSASMRVKDVPGDRWQRSTRFLRMLGDSMSWKQDRIAMAVFARIAAPQIRLTTDPNTFFFFLDNLEKAPPFRLEDDSTWDTNLELGIHWGLRLIEKDEELHGPTSNARIFVLMTDGEAWSGEVEKSLQNAVDAKVPLFVVGVGTLAGGKMPVWVPKTPDEEVDSGDAAVLATGSGGPAEDCCRGRRASTSSSTATAIATSPTRSSMRPSVARRRLASPSSPKSSTGAFS